MRKTRPLAESDANREIFNFFVIVDAEKPGKPSLAESRVALDLFIAVCSILKLSDYCRSECCLLSAVVEGCASLARLELHRNRLQTLPTVNTGLKVSKLCGLFNVQCCSMESSHVTPVRALHHLTA